MLMAYLHVLSLHDALPICRLQVDDSDSAHLDPPRDRRRRACQEPPAPPPELGIIGTHIGRAEYTELRRWRAEEHTSELQSPCKLVFIHLLIIKRRSCIRK